MYIAASVAVACWLYGEHLRHNDGVDSAPWLVAFLFMGGFFAPLYYFQHRRELQAHDPPAPANLTLVAMRVLVAVLLVSGCVRMCYVLIFALGHLHVSHTYLVISGVDRWLMRLALLLTLLILIRHPWRLSLKTAWFLASVVGSFLVMPVLYFSRFNHEVRSRDSRGL